MADPFDADIEASYKDLDPNTGAAQRAKAMGEHRRKMALDAQKRRDADWLLNQPQFCRWLFTEFQRAGIMDSSFHAHEGLSQFQAGFRAFGLAMFNDLEARDPGLLIRVANERTKYLQWKDKPDDGEHHDHDEGGA